MAAIAHAGLSIGCGGKAEQDRRGTGGRSGGAGAAGAGSGGADAVCVAPKQGVVPLSLLEITRAIAALLGPELAESLPPEVGHASAICDARVDSNEISTQCLSYGYDTQVIESANPGGPITEHVPLLPSLSPYDLYVRVFGAFAPDATLSRQLRLRKSVLDSALRELTRLRELAPSSQRERSTLTRRSSEGWSSGSGTLARCPAPLARSSRGKAARAATMPVRSPTRTTGPRWNSSAGST